MKRILAVVVALILLGAGLWWWGSAERAPAPRRDLPHVVLVVLCSVRADQVPLYGGAWDTMPFVTDLGDAGLVFGDAVTAAPWTRPAITAISTGHHPGTVGMLEPRDKRSDRVLPAAVDTLAERLRAAGYYSVGRSANPNISALFGFDQGFDDFANLSPRWRDGVHKVRGSDVVDDLLLAFDARPAGRPAFVEAVFIDAHQPMTASPVAGARWREPGEPLRVGRYRAMLRSTDAAVARLFGALEERGLRDDNTVFIVVNDHGEGLRFPEHHGKGHGRYLYPSTTQMLWVMKGRGVGQGIVPGLASQVDLMPTLLEHLDLPLPSMDGHSLARSVADPSHATGRERAFAATMFANTERGAIVSAEAYCLDDFGDGRAEISEAERGKPVFAPACYRRDDPAGLEPVEASELRAELGRWWEEMVARSAVWGEDGASVPDDVSAALEALGYLGE